MSVPIKLGLGVLSLSAVAVPGLWMAITAEPGSKTLDDSSSTEHKDKFGEDFKYHLVDATEGKNQSWWDWSFKYRWQADGEEEKEPDFKGITGGSSLSQKCKEIYDKVSNTEDKKSAWRYCSLEGQKPVTIQVSKDKKDSYSENMGKTYEAHLVSTQDFRNNKFWEVQEKAFFKETNGLGSKATGDSSFKALYDSKKGSLREKCQELYEKKESDASKDKKDMLVFCSLDPRKST